MLAADVGRRALASRERNMDVTTPMRKMDDERALDNPVWSCLITRHAHLARGDGRARRYPAHFSPLSGVAMAAPAHVKALLALVDVNDDISIPVVDVPEMPPGWDVQKRLTLTQMIRRDPTPLQEGSEHIETLTSADVEEMLALVELTHPGPFRRRTVELGTFVGIRREGQLLAMAGERMWVGAYREISGVCTHPEAQRHGLARALLSRVVNRMLGAGETPFLHVESGNERAIATYESLGFVRRAQFPLVHAQRLR
jgi:predicted GNAT family acetyltransferase